MKPVAFSVSFTRAELNALLIATSGAQGDDRASAREKIADLLKRAGEEPPETEAATTERIERYRDNVMRDRL